MSPCRSKKRPCESGLPCGPAPCDVTPCRAQQRYSCDDDTCDERGGKKQVYGDDRGGKKQVYGDDRSGKKQVYECTDTTCKERTGRVSWQKNATILGGKI